MTTKLKINSSIEFISGFRSPPGRFRILGERPSETGEITYRVKGENEAFERIALHADIRALPETNRAGE